VRRGDVEESAARRAIDVWSRLGLERVGVSGLLGRIWELRGNLSAYDATYVAVAEAFGVPLVTADGRLTRAPGPRCTISVVRG
jgi:predicted nucleic acid-binding protein